MIVILLCSFISAILFYMHKVDPVYSLPISLLCYALPTEAAIYFAIMFSGAVIEHKTYRIPNLVILLSLFPIFYNNIAMITGIIYSIPIAIAFIYSRYKGSNIVSIEDVKTFFSIGLFLRSAEYLLPIYALSILLWVPYSMTKHKLVPLSLPLVSALYLLNLVV